MIEEKKSLRISLSAKRNAIDPLLREEKNRTIIRRIRALDHYQSSKMIAIFYPLPGEVDLRPLLEDAQHQFCFPKVLDVRDAKLVFMLSGEKWEKHRFGLNEPTGLPVLREHIDMIICPGLGFSPRGGRIGYGKGFYDAYLSGYQGITIGVCFKEQMVPDLPMSPFDRWMDIMITDEETLCIQR